jgi:hypothetical protein
VRYATDAEHVAAEVAGLGDAGLRLFAIPGVVSREVTYGQFIVEATSRIYRRRDQGVEAVEREVAQLIESIEHARAVPEVDAVHLRLRIYEAAVQASYSPTLGRRGLRLLMSRPALFGADHRTYSQALLFATASDQLDELLDQLETMLDEPRDPLSRFAALLACAKLSLIRNDPVRVSVYASRAAGLTVPPVMLQRARQLDRAGDWLQTSAGPQISQWRLRTLHPLLPRTVAERLEESGLAELRGEGASPEVRHALAGATAMLASAAKVAEDPNGGLPALREALGSWANHVALTLLHADEPGAAVPFAGAAWRLLEPDPQHAVIAIHARAVAGTCAGLSEPEVKTAADTVAAAMHATDEQRSVFISAILAEWRAVSDGRPAVAPAGPPALLRMLEPAAKRQPRPTLETAARASANRLVGVPGEVGQLIETCLMDRNSLLPVEPPFRGRKWFEGGVAHKAYQTGRDEVDGRLSYKAFEDAWHAEPNNRITIQGTIHGLRRRLRQKPGRDHLLRRLALMLDQITDREVEAALAYCALAELAGPVRHWDHRTYLRKAAAALGRRVDRQSWTKARNAQIATWLELGEMTEAGNAALAESRAHLPGTTASTRYAQLALALWERAGNADRPSDDDVDLARRRVESLPLTPRESVRYAAAERRLVLLTDTLLDEDALEDLWWVWRGSRDVLHRFLEKQGRRSNDPRPHYLTFLDRKLRAQDPVAAKARSASFPRASVAIGMLRLATAEVLCLDPVRELAIPTEGLAEAHVSDFVAILSEQTGPDQAAVKSFIVAVDEALATLFELFRLRETPSPSSPELDGSRLATASWSLLQLRQVAEQFREPYLAVARLISRHLALALERPMIAAYQSEKDKRLVASRLAGALGLWWSGVYRVAGPLDFLHQHQAYRCPAGANDAETMRWWKSHQVHGKPVREAVLSVRQALGAHAEALDKIEQQYWTTRPRQPGPPGFGLREKLDECCGVLDAALAATAGPREVRGVVGALERLGTFLRHIDPARLEDQRDLLYEPGLLAESYVLPRSDELLSHWGQNAGHEPWQQFVFEVHDDAGQDVACLMCVDAGTHAVPKQVRLRGLAPFAELVEALGGELHLWVARSGEQYGCRREHGEGAACDTDEYVRRIEKRLRDLTRTTWLVQRAEVERWLNVLDAALRANGNACVAFAILPRLHE